MSRRIQAIDFMYYVATPEFMDQWDRAKEGELVVHGRPKDILTENIIEKAFNIKTKVIENPVTGKPLVIYN